MQSAFLVRRCLSSVPRLASFTNSCLVSSSVTLPSLCSLSSSSSSSSSLCLLLRRHVASASSSSSSSPSSSLSSLSSSSSSSVPSSSTGDQPVSSNSEFKTTSTFSSLNLHPLTIKSLNDDFKYEYMSVVQNACIGQLLTGVDVNAKAKTGTGKTLAFLIPAVEKLTNPQRFVQSQEHKAKTNKNGIKVLIIAPARELAMQIADEARTLSKYHKLRIACCVGGTNINTDQRAVSGGLDILIATPGRLLDLLKNYNGFQQQMSHLSMLILDEADRLLDMGFSRDLDDIFARIPDRAYRQTLLFSATSPPNVKSMCARVLRPNYQLIDTVGKEESTHSHVPQEYLISSPDNMWFVLWEVLQEQRKVKDFKIIVFLPTARQTEFAAALFNAARVPNCLELHSRLSQPRRVKTSDNFRDNSQTILFSSDVSARGMDFPNVTAVIQVGLTTSEQYVHRLGRTARAGNNGKGILILNDFEKPFLSEIKHLPIQPAVVTENTLLSTLTKPGAQAMSLTDQNKSSSHPLKSVLSTVESSDALRISAWKCYQAWLGFYNSNLRLLGWDKATLVQFANKFSATCGLKTIPAVEAKILGKMGLRNVPGIKEYKSPTGGKVGVGGTARGKW